MTPSSSECLEDSSDDRLAVLFEEAHSIRDNGRLAGLYAEAARRAAVAGDIDAQAFLLTQAYVYALEIGDERSGALRDALVRLGREHDERA